MFWSCPNCHNIFCEGHAVLHQCDTKLSRIPKEITTDYTECIVCRFRGMHLK